MTSAVSEPRRTPAVPLQFVWLLPAAVWYALLLCADSSGMTAPVPHGLVFNSMAAHLLHGGFDVDPGAIGDEGYLRNGLVYAYFGVYPALFRMLFLPLADFATTDFTRIGCLSAVVAMAVFKALSVRLVAREGLAATLLLAAILAGGAQIEFLRPSIFQEVGLWAAAWAAVFVYLFLRGWQGEFSGRLTSLMAGAAGMCLLTRVSTALGLYLALGLLWLADRNARRVAPVAILIGFAAAAGAINLARWGNPLVFADLSRALMLERFPDRLARLHDYGEFNPVRIPFAAGYYFFPIWAEMLWSGFRDRVFDAVELPPASFFTTDPLLLGLAAYGVATGGRRVLAVLAGLFVPIFLMLMAISLTFRYRLEFYPFIELAAFVGLARAGDKARTWIALGAVYSIVAAHLMWVLTMLSPFGPVQSVVGPDGVLAFYLSEFM